MIRDESYIHIWWWMLNRLNLKWNELLVYATIHSFTNWTDEHCYRWSAWYLSERCWLDKRSVYRVLNKLEDKWYIKRKERIENWVKFVDYYTPSVTNVTPPDKMSLGGSDILSPHNNSIDNDSIIVPAEGEQQEGEYQEGDNKPFKQSSTSKGNTKVPQLDKPKIYVMNSNDIREVLSEEQILQYNIQLRILLKMIGMWYKVEKKESKIMDEINWLKAKANLYNIKKPDWQIAWLTFLQRIDKWVDWHEENNVPVKKFKTSIIPFISKP